MIRSRWAWPTRRPASKGAVPPQGGEASRGTLRGMTNGQKLDLGTAVGLTVYAAVVTLVPSAAPLAITFAAAPAAGLAAVAAFTRFAVSFRKPAKAAK